MANYATFENGVVIPTDDVLKWAPWFEKHDRKIALTPFNGGKVSTVFLGINHGFGYGGDLWFETMVFGGELDQECDRYATLEEAMLGHERMVARVKAASAGGDDE